MLIVLGDLPITSLPLRDLGDLIEFLLCLSLVSEWKNRRILTHVHSRNISVLVPAVMKTLREWEKLRTKIYIRKGAPKGRRLVTTLLLFGMNIVIANRVNSITSSRWNPALGSTVTDRQTINLFKLTGMYLDSPSGIKTCLTCKRQFREYPGKKHKYRASTPKNLTSARLWQ